MLNVQIESEAGTETHPLTVGRHTAGDAPADPIKLPGAGAAALYLDVTAAGLIVIPRRGGALLSEKPLTIGHPRLLLPTDRLKVGSTTLSVLPSNESTGTAAAARGMLAGAPPRLPAIVWLNGADCGRRHTLELGSNIIGRSETCAVRVRDALASRTHAKLSLDAASALLEPLGCPNGLYVDGERIEAPRPLRGRERIQIGDTELYFDACLEPPEPEPLSEPQPEPDAVPEPATAPPPAPKKRTALTLLEMTVVVGGTFAAATGAALCWLLAR